MAPLSNKFFYASQRAWITDDAPLTICEKGRQLGFSYAHSYKVVRRAAKAGAKDEWVMSRDEIQAKQFILYTKRWANVLKYAAQDLGEQVFTSDSGKQICVQVLRLASGASIYALSSNPDAIVGKTGHVTLDEFALHKNQRELYAVAKPVTQWGGTLSIISTHRGVGTLFNEIIQKIKEAKSASSSSSSSSSSLTFGQAWSLHSVPVQKAVDEGLVEKIDEVSNRGSSLAPLPSHLRDARRQAWLQQMRAECIDEEQWLQEYCCVPADEASAFLSYDLIHSCEDPAAMRDFGYLLDAKNPLYVGVDVARKKDLFVIDVGELQGDVLWDRFRLELQNKKFGELEYELHRILTLPQVKRCCIDATGMGMQLAERAKDRFGYRVEPITFTPSAKEELAFGLRAAFEDRRLRIARDDKLRADLRGIKKEVTLSGNIRFVGESDDSHCDRFWAKALRQYALARKQEVFAIIC
jgi:phage FluMu gp28-like protein